MTMWIRYSVNTAYGAYYMEASYPAKRVEKHIKAVFHFSRIVAKRISLFREHSGRTNDMDTIEYATFRYDTAEVKNGLLSTRLAG